MIKESLVAAALVAALASTGAAMLWAVPHARGASVATPATPAVELPPPTVELREAVVAAARPATPVRDVPSRATAPRLPTATPSAPAALAAWSCEPRRALVQGEHGVEECAPSGAPPETARRSPPRSLAMQHAGSRAATTRTPVEHLQFPAE